MCTMVVTICVWLKVHAYNTDTICVISAHYLFRKINHIINNASRVLPNILVYNATVQQKNQLCEL